MLVSQIEAAHEGDPHLFLGTNRGLVVAGDQEDMQNDLQAAYTSRITTPTITRFETQRGRVPETQEKGFIGVVTYFNPKGAYSANLSVTVDRRVQNYTIDLSGAGDPLT